MGEFLLHFEVKRFSLCKHFKRDFKNESVQKPSPGTLIKIHLVKYSGCYYPVNQSKGSIIETLSFKIQPVALQIRYVSAGPSTALENSAHSDFHGEHVVLLITCPPDAEIK